MALFNVMEKALGFFFFNLLVFSFLSPFSLCGTLIDSASSNRKCVSSSFCFSPPSLPNLNLCILKKKKKSKKENRNIWRDKCNTTLIKSDEKSHSFICGEIRFIIRKAFSFHFLKGAFWQTLCRGRHTHKTCCHRAIWIWWQAHYHVEESWQHCRGEMDRPANQLLKRRWLK